MADHLSIDSKTNNKISSINEGLFSTQLFKQYKKWPVSIKTIITIIALMNILLISSVIISLFAESSVLDVLKVFKSINVLSAFKITLFSLSVSALLTIILGVPFSFFIVKKDNKLNRVLNVLITLPLLLPPSITGLALLLTFGSRGILADITSNIAFSFTALIIVQLFVMLPLFTQSLKNGFSAVNNKMVEAALVGGAGEKELLFNIYLPLNIRSFSTGLIMAVLRGAGEFGATMIFAGNLSGKTQTLSTAIYSLTQTDLSQAVALAVIMITAFILPLILLEFKIKA